MQGFYIPGSEGQVPLNPCHTRKIKEKVRGNLAVSDK